MILFDDSVVQKFSVGSGIARCITSLKIFESRT